MNQFILASHGGMSAGLKSTLELIWGEMPNVYAIATTRDEKEPITVAARHLLDNFDPNDQVFILTDVLGGSVNNDMMTLLEDYPHITILCGTNACLAISLATYNAPISDEELDNLLREAQQQIINCNKRLKDVDEEDDL